MSLSDVVLEIVAEMEECLAESGDKVPAEHSSIKSWAKQLRRAVQAAAPNALDSGAVAGGRLIVPALQPDDPIAGKVAKPDDPLKNATPHRLLLFDRARRMLEDQEGAALLGNMAMMVGGSCNGDSHPIGVQAQVGQLFERDGEIYVLKEDNKLHFSAVETVKFKSLKSPQG